MKFKNIAEATREWVREFNAIPQSLIEKAYFGDNFDDSFAELTPKTYQCESCYTEYSESEAEKNNYECECVVDGEENEDEDEVVYGELVEKEEYDYLPMWGTMWTLNDSSDESWVEDNLETVKDCGFRIYESEDLGVILGIDGAGYNFYDEHWIPLYKARGLQWHIEE